MHTYFCAVVCWVTIELSPQVDAFTDSAFKGNPAAVCLLEEERDDKWLQAVATEFNISETCYLTRINDPESDILDSIPRFRLRWFTPVAEVCSFITYSSQIEDNSLILFVNAILGFVLAEKLKEKEEEKRVQNKPLLIFSTFASIVWLGVKYLNSRAIESIGVIRSTETLKYLLTHSKMMFTQIKSSFPHSNLGLHPGLSIGVVYIK